MVSAITRSVAFVRSLLIYLLYLTLAEAIPIPIPKGGGGSSSSGSSSSGSSSTSSGSSSSSSSSSSDSSSSSGSSSSTGSGTTTSSSSSGGTRNTTSSHCESEDTSCLDKRKLAGIIVGSILGAILLLVTAFYVYKKWWKPRRIRKRLEQITEDRSVKHACEVPSEPLTAKGLPQFVEKEK